MVQLHLAGLPSTTTNVFTDTILIRPIRWHDEGIDLVQSLTHNVCSPKSL